MSGPYCKDCKLLRRMPLGDAERGECTDYTKKVYDRNGNVVVEPPEVHEMYTCANWTDGGTDAR